MPIRGLEEFLNERRLVQTGSLSSLANTRLGVEGTMWLKNLPTDEPFQLATGGVPLTMLSTIDAELAKFRKAAVKPLFVFSGLSVVRKERPFLGNADGRSVKRSNAWDAYYKGHLPQAASLFKLAEKYISLNFMTEVFHHFHASGVEFMRALYYSWPQLAWLNEPKQGLVEGIYAGLELLLFAVPRLILSIDFESGTYEWVEHAAVLRELNMSHDQFVDACIIAGFDLSSTFPPLLEQHFTFRTAYEMVKTFKTALAAVHHYAGHPQVQKLNYFDVVLRTRALLRHHIIFPTNCRAEPLNKNTCPSDLHEVVGPRLPDELYYFVSQGTIGVQVLNNLLSGMLIEAPPLVDSEEYRRALMDLLDIRAKTLAILSQPLNDYYKHRRIVTVRWFDPMGEMEVLDAASYAEVAGLVEPVISRHAPIWPTQPLIDHHLQRSGIRDFGPGFWFVLNMLSVSATDPPLLSALQSMHSTHQDVYLTLDELRCGVVTQALELRGYLTLIDPNMPSHNNPRLGLTVLGRALSLVDPHFQEEAFLILELLNTDHLHSHPLQTYQRTPILEANSGSAREITLLSRVVSVLGMAMYEDKPWSGPIDHELMGFHSIVKASARSLRNLVETLALHSILIHKSRLGVHEYGNLWPSLPLLKENSTAMGIVIKYYLLGDDIDALLAKFPSCKNIAADLHNAFNFWNEVMKMVVYLRDCQFLSMELYSEFAAANRLAQTPF